MTAPAAQRTARHAPTRANSQPGVHLCPVQPCGLRVSPGHVCCRQHWRAIPSHLREPLREAFRTRGTDPVGYARAVIATADLAQTYAGRTT